MKSLSITEAVQYLGEDKYAVSLENVWYRRLLHRVGEDADRSKRIERFFDPAPHQFSYVFLAMADWLPRNTHRLLWIDHFEDGYPSQTRHFLNILGTDLPSDHLIENPAILLGPFSSDLIDQPAGTPEQDDEGEALIALCTLLSVGNWDAKLLAKGSTDYVEFWEGNVLFYSQSAEAIERAEEMLEQYGLNTSLG